MIFLFIILIVCIFFVTVILIKENIKENSIVSQDFFYFWKYIKSTFLENEPINFKYYNVFRDWHHGIFEHFSYNKCIFENALKLSKKFENMVNVVSTDDMEFAALEILKYKDQEYKILNIIYILDNINIAILTMKGEYGNGINRIKNLKDKGYDYTLIQRIINTLIILGDIKSHLADYPFLSRKLIWVFKYKKKIVDIVNNRLNEILKEIDYNPCIECALADGEDKEKIFFKCRIVNNINLKMICPLGLAKNINKEDFDNYL